MIFFSLSNINIRYDFHNAVCSPILDGMISYKQRLNPRYKYQGFLYGKALVKMVTKVPSKITEKKSVKEAVKKYQTIFSFTVNFKSACEKTDKPK